MREGLKDAQLGPFSGWQGDKEIAVDGRTRYALSAEAVSLGAPLLACSPDGGAREVSRLA